MARPKGKLLALVAMFVAIGIAAGTGAFTTVTAERTADVDVAGDSGALLAIDAASGSNGDYVGTDGGETQLLLSGPQGASGVNPNATTAVDGVITVTNQGTQGVYVAVERSGPNTDAIEFGVQDSDVAFNDSSLSGDPSGSIGIRGGESAIPITADGGNSANNAVYLSPGESITLGFYVDTTDSDPLDGPGTDGTELDADDEVLDSVTFVAASEEGDLSTTVDTVYTPA